MEDFEEKEMMKFSWTGLFAVTSFCFFLFSLFIKLINGSYLSLFLTISSISLILAALSYLNKRLVRKEEKKRTKEIPPIFQQD